MVVPIRNLFRNSTEDLRNKLKCSIDLEYDDGIVKSKPQEAIIMTHILLILPKEQKILSKYHITNYYTNGFFTKSSINKCFEVILEDLVRTNEKYRNRENLKEIYSFMFQINNNIYNYIACKEHKYVTGIHIQDLLDIQMDKKLLKSIDDAKRKPSPNSINKTYEVLEEVIKNNRNNTIAKYYLSGTVNANQIKQLLGSRGYITELNNALFKYPVTSSFTLGMQNLYDLAIESRAGAKALYLSNKAVQDTEYFARELQLITMSLERLVDTDCGSTNYLEWFIKDKDDLERLLGKFLDNGNPITKDDKHLINTLVRIRTPLNCKLPKPNEICTKCFGELAYTIATHSNIGHFCSTIVTQKLTQSILSTKHLATSATSGNFNITEGLNGLIQYKNGNLYFNSKTDTKRNKIIMKIVQDEFKQLTVLRTIENIKNISVSNLSKLYNINICINNKEYILTQKETNKYVSLSHSMLNYILENYSEIDITKDILEINLNKYIQEHYTEPFIVIPNIEYNFLSLSRSIKSLIRTIDTEKTTPEQILQELYNLVNSKLNVNLAILEVIITSLQCNTKDNFNISKDPNNKQIVKSTAIIKRRSLSAAYDWEKVIDNVLSPYSYYRKGIQSHPLDSMIIKSISI